MQLINNTNGNYTPRQLKLPLEIEKNIDISDPVYTFCDVMDHIDLSKYFVDLKGCKTGRPRCDAEKLLKVILFAFMEYGFCSLREIEKLCRTDIRYMYLLDEMKAPYGTISSNKTITNATARVVDGSGRDVISVVSYNPNSKNINVKTSTLNKKLDFNKISKTGNYRMIITATDSSGNTQTYVSNFRVY